MLSIDHVKELNSLEHLFISAAKNDWKSDMPLVLLGEKGSGKTAAVQKYCTQHSHRLYFSFRNLTSDIAPKFFSEQYPEYFHTEFIQIIHIYSPSILSRSSGSAVFSL